MVVASGVSGENPGIVGLTEPPQWVATYATAAGEQKNNKAVLLSDGFIESERARNARTQALSSRLIMRYNIYQCRSLIDRGGSENGLSSAAAEILYV